MYQMLGLYEDCLVQYDELDALFTQFVLNYAAGGQFITVTPVITIENNYLRQVCYVLAKVRLFVCLSVSKITQKVIDGSF